MKSYTHFLNEQTEKSKSEMKESVVSGSSLYMSALQSLYDKYSEMVGYSDETFTSDDDYGPFEIDPMLDPDSEPFQRAKAILSGVPTSVDLATANDLLATMRATGVLMANSDVRIRQNFLDEETN